LTDLITNNGLIAQIPSAELAVRIEKNQNKLLHFVENFEEYMVGPPYPDYENIKE